MNDIEQLTAIAVRVGAGQSLHEAYREVVGPKCDWCGAAVVPASSKGIMTWKHADGYWNCELGLAQVDGSNVCKVPA